MKYPYTKKVNVVDDYHGTKVADPYRWLEETNSTEVQDWLAEQIKLTEGYFSGVAYREQIRKMVTDVYHFERYVPAGDVAKFGKLMFFNKSSNHDQSSKLYMQNGVEGKEELLIDPGDYAQGYSHANIRDISDDGKYCVFSNTRMGSDWCQLRILDLKKRLVLPEVIDWTSRNVEFYKDGFFYSCFDTPEEGKEV
jgi:prolyl oligopeptidase